MATISDFIGFNEKKIPEKEVMEFLQETESSEILKENPELYSDILELLDTGSTSYILPKGPKSQWVKKMRQVLEKLKLLAYLDEKFIGNTGSIKVTIRLAR